MFGSNKKQARTEKIAKHNRAASNHDKEAREAAKKIAGLKKSLKSGSSDPAADRYLIRQAEQEQATARHNARVCRDAAERASKRRF